MRLTPPCFAQRPSRLYSSLASPVSTCTIIVPAALTACMVAISLCAAQIETCRHCSVDCAYLHRRLSNHWLHCPRPVTAPHPCSLSSDRAGAPSSAMQADEQCSQVWRGESVYAFTGTRHDIHSAAAHLAVHRSGNCAHVAIAVACGTITTARGIFPCIDACNRPMKSKVQASSQSRGVPPVAITMESAKSHVCLTSRMTTSLACASAITSATCSTNRRIEHERAF